MISFEELAEGEEVIVTDGNPEPPDKDSLPWRQWASHNFRGRVLEKRQEAVDIQTPHGITWTLDKSVGHTFTPTNPSEELLNRTYSAKVETQVSEFRSKYLTSIPGQDAVYQRKEEEARRWKKGAKATDFPYLSNEAAARKVSLTELASKVLTAAEEARRLDVAVETARIKAKLAVEKARGQKAKEQASVIDWSTIVNGGI